MIQKQINNSVQSLWRGYPHHFPFLLVRWKLSVFSREANFVFARTSVVARTHFAFLASWNRRVVKRLETGWQAWVTRHAAPPNKISCAAPAPACLPSSGIRWI